jgi:hypothetical protein
MKECIKEVFDSAVVRRDLIKVMTDQVLARINVAPPVQYPPVVPIGTGAPLPQQPVTTSAAGMQVWNNGGIDAEG